MPGFLLTINVPACGWAPANTAYGISCFASFLTMANDIQVYDLFLVLLQSLKTPCFMFWVTSFVVSSVSDIRMLNHINCKNEIPKLKLLSRLQWSLYVLLTRGCWASHIYIGMTEESLKGWGWCHWFTELCSRNCRYVVYVNTILIQFKPPPPPGVRITVWVGTSLLTRGVVFQSD